MITVAYACDRNRLYRLALLNAVQREIDSIKVSGYGRAVQASAFQAEHAGSIPAARSTEEVA